MLGGNLGSLLYGDVSVMENITMLYTAIFHGCKKDNFQIKNCDFNFNFAQNIDEAVLTSTHNLCLRAKIRKKMYTPVNPSFTI